METLVLSPWSRFANAIASPREAFRDLPSAPNKAMLWLIPVLLTVVISAVGVSLNGHMYMEEGRKEMEARFDKMVAEGKMSQEQVDQARMRAESMMGSNIFVYIIAVVWPFLKVVLIAAVFLFVINFGMKGQVSYIDVLATLGISEIIYVLNMLVTMLLVNATGSMHASLSPTLFLADFNNKNFLHSALSHLNVFAIWGLYVFAIGISEVTGKKQSDAMKWVFGLWILWIIITVALGQLRFSFGG